MQKASFHLLTKIILWLEDLHYLKDINQINNPMPFASCYKTATKLNIGIHNNLANNVTMTSYELFSLHTIIQQNQQSTFVFQIQS